MNNNKNKKIPALNKLLKDLRLKEEISQEKLAKRFGEGKAVISSYENGGYLGPNKALKILTKGFKLPLSEAKAMIAEARITDDEFLSDEQKGQMVNIVKGGGIGGSGVHIGDIHQSNGIDDKILKVLMDKETKEKEALLKMLESSKTTDILKGGTSGMERLARIDAFLKREKKLLRDEDDINDI